jgi:hypothetical protein
VKRLPWNSLVLLLICYAGFGWYLSGFEAPHPPWLVSGCFQILGETAPRMAQLDEMPKSTEAEMIERMIANRKKVTPPEIAPKETLKVEADAVQADNQPASPKPTVNLEKPQPADSQKADPAKSEPPERSPNPVKSASPSRSKQVCTLIFKHNLPISLIAVSWIFISSAAFISPLTSFNEFISRWFHSDTVAFMAIFTAAGMAAIILFWLHVFLQILTILAAEALARIDIQVARMSGIQAYWILTVVSMTGLIAGWLANGVV